MLFLFIHSSFCLKKQVFDFITRQYPSSIHLYVNPMEMVELKIKKGVGSFFAEMYSNNYISIEVESKNADGSIRTRGPYDSNSLLVGLVFKTSNYKIVLYNDGPYVEHIFIIFGENFSYVCNHTITHGDAVPASWLFSPQDSFESISYPIIYNYDHQNAVWGIGILIPCLVIVFLFYTFKCRA